jgi:hypothetical protein
VLVSPAGGWNVLVTSPKKPTRLLAVWQMLLLIGGRAAWRLLVRSWADSSPGSEITDVLGRSSDNGRLTLAVEQRLGVLEVGRVEALGEPAVDRCQQLVCVLPLALAVGSVPTAFAFAAIGAGWADQPILALAVSYGLPILLLPVALYLMRRRAS